MRVLAWLGLVVLGGCSQDVTFGAGPEEEPVALANLASGQKGIWISPGVLMSRPTSGAAWNAVLKAAQASPGTASIAYQDSQHDLYTLAEALVCARTGQYCTKARASLLSAIGTERGARWMAVGRNLTSYVIAADVLGLRADGNPTSDGTRLQSWIASFLTMQLADNNTGVMEPFPVFTSGSNGEAQQGAAYAAIAAYLGDTTALRKVWDAFRRYACDPTAPSPRSIDLSKGVIYNWAHSTTVPCAVNPAGTRKAVPAGYPGAGGVYRIDGAIINDMRRGDYYQWVPVYTSYPWVGMEGFVPAAVILDRAGYPAFEVADRAVLRAADYLWYLRTQTGDTRWFDGVRSAEIVQLVNVVYGTKYPVKTGIGKGRTVGYTDWTDSTWPD